MMNNSAEFNQESLDNKVFDAVEDIYKTVSLILDAISQDSLVNKKEWLDKTSQFFYNIDTTCRFIVSHYNQLIDDITNKEVDIADVDHETDMIHISLERLKRSVVNMYSSL